MNVFSVLVIICIILEITANTKENWQELTKFWNRSLSNSERIRRQNNKTSNEFNNLYGHTDVIGKPSKIIRGERARSNQFPYVVSVQYKGLIFTYHVCGGVIISRFYALTAAHCVEEKRKYLVEAGLLTFEQNNNDTQVLEAAQIFTHERFYKSHHFVQNDIALIRLGAPLRWTMSILAVKLPRPGVEFRGDAVVCGWGRTERGVESSWLRFLNVDLISTRECNDELRKIGDTSRVLDSNICSSGSSGMSACFGDSGSPLVQDGVLVGLVSWGIGSCGKLSEPTVYTKCSSYVPWINARLTFT